MNNSLSTIFVLPGSETRYVHLEIFKLLKQHHQTTIHLYCNTAQDIQFYTEYRDLGVIDTVTRVCSLYDCLDAKKLDDDAVFLRARKNENYYGCTYNHLAVSDRHLGRGYALGGFAHPRSRYSESSSYVQVVNAYNEVFKFWEAEFLRWSPDLFVGGGKIIATISRAHKVPYRFMAGSRYRNLFFWAEDEYFSVDKLSQIFSNEVEVNMAEIESPYYAHMTNRKRFLKSAGLLGLSHAIFHTVVRRAYWQLKGYEKGRGYYLFDELSLFVRRWLDGKKMSGRNVKRLDDIKKTKFVYYPLHTEPETALQTLSPEYFYQLSCIAALSRDLPAGVLLVVKETLAATGRRPRDFYEQIREFKNVVFLNIEELGLEIVRNAAAVATITGTGGFEAAVIGKPVISFGRHNLYNILDHVRVITDEAELKNELASVLSNNFNKEKANLDGARYLAAVKAISFDMGEFSTINGRNFTSESIQEAYKGLLDGL